MDEKWIKSNVKCCACGGSLKGSRYINIVSLDKLAEWSYPVWGNVLVMDKHPENRAVAIVCDDCAEKKRKVKFAVEWDEEKKEVKYHPVEKLKDLPPINEGEIIEAERRLYGLRTGIM